MFAQYVNKGDTMSSKVTIQDIADALGISRNTVSKAINNTGVLADATREKVLAKAAEMGYKQFSYVNPLNSSILDGASKKPIATGEIALFSGNFLGNAHFASTMLDKFQNEISNYGYSMTMHRISEDIIDNKILPSSLNLERTKAIICVEMFNYEYCKMLSELDVPVLFVDAPYESYFHPLNADVLLMENTSGIFSLVEAMKNRGIKKIGYIGQKYHCRSFFERYLAYYNAMHHFDLDINKDFILTDINPHNEMYKQRLFDCLSKLDHLPDLFVCANDFVCMDALNCFDRLNLECPKDILLSGFDDSTESKLINPTLTTIHIHSQVMGMTAANLILSRIQQPDMNYRTIYTETNLIYRESTSPSK